jgi:Domain of Unknown Function (DUF928)
MNKKGQKLLIILIPILLVMGLFSNTLADWKPRTPVGNPKPRQIRPGGIYIRWNPPKDTGAPGRRQVRAGGSRDSCSDLIDSQKNEIGSLTALVPDKIEGKINYEKPKFLVYLPYKSQQKYNYEFVLRDENEEEVYKVKTAIKPQPGIITISLPDNISLQRNQTYSWTFAFIFAEANTNCNPSQIRSAELVEGAISLDKNPPNTTLLNKFKTATIEEKITIYTEQGWWYDALINLAELRRKYPNDANIKAAWIALLKAENLEELAEFAILP